jgi:hypothetical protein
MVCFSNENSCYKRWVRGGNESIVGNVDHACLVLHRRGLRPHCSLRYREESVESERWIDMSIGEGKKHNAEKEKEERTALHLCGRGPRGRGGHWRDIGTEWHGEARARHLVVLYQRLQAVEVRLRHLWEEEEADGRLKTSSSFFVSSSCSCSFSSILCPPRSHHLFLAFLFEKRERKRPCRGRGPVCRGWCPSAGSRQSSGS